MENMRTGHWKKLLTASVLASLLPGGGGGGGGGAVC